MPEHTSPLDTRPLERHLMFARTQAAPRVFRMVGLGSLALANVAQMLLRHYHRPAGDLGDGLLGAL
jgi:hypothetical protein